MSVAFSAQPSHEVDLDLGHLVLDVANRKVRGLDKRIDNSIIDGTLERTIDGASTLTLVVHDPDRVLLRSGIFAQAIGVRLDRLSWRLVRVGKQADDLTLTFEDREVALLRAQTGPKKSSNTKGKPVKLETARRGKVTRAEFALSLVREVKTPAIPFVCPDLHTKQAIENAKQGRTDTSRAQQRQRGLSRKSSLTIKGKQADQGQLSLAERVLDVADSVDAGPKATLALIEACIVESLITNPSGASADGYGSRGVLQVRDSTGSFMGITNTDPAQCANAFLRRGFTGKGSAIDLARQHPGWSAGQIAQACQGSAYPTRYDQYQAEAQAFLDAYNGAGVTDSRTVSRNLPYQFRRGSTDGKPEDSWTCLQRLAQEVNWRCFMSAGSLYFISDIALLKAKPRLILDEDSPGVMGIDFDCDQGKPLSEVTITARASRWVAAPGAVVQIQNCGPADGRWLVATISRGLFDAAASITLRAPAKPYAEPAPDTTSVTTGAATAAGSLAGDQPSRAYQAAQSITAKRYPYVWGGGHAHCGTPDGGTGRDPGIGYDCSGSVCAVLANAGMGLTLGAPGMASGALMSWGASGRGQGLTVYTRDSGPAGHAFIIFHTAQGDQHFGTGDWGKGWTGPGFTPRLHPTDGFLARHWPGT